MAQVAPEVGEFVRPPIDWHAAAPELTLLAVGAIITMMDIAWLEKGRRTVAAFASLGLLITMIPVLTLAWDGTDRSMFGGAFIVDRGTLRLLLLDLDSPPGRVDEVHDVKSTAHQIRDKRRPIVL